MPARASPWCGYGATNDAAGYGEALAGLVEFRLRASALTDIVMVNGLMRMRLARPDRCRSLEGQQRMPPRLRPSAGSASGFWGACAIEDVTLALQASYG